MAKQESKFSRAWLLDFGRGLQAAVGLHEMWQVLISPELFDVPHTPFYCNEVLVFQRLILPVIDMPSLLEGQKIIHAHNDVVGVAVYQQSSTDPIHYGGLHLATTPQAIYVSDEQACDLPFHQKYWEPLTIACFEKDNVAIPILNLAYLFSKEFNLAKQGTLKIV
jgi:chemotaxis signal transduction protein